MDDGRPLAGLPLATRNTPQNPLKGLTEDRNRYAKHIAPHLGERRLEELSWHDIEALSTSLKVTDKRTGEEKDASAATCHRVIELARRLVNYGLEREYFPPLPGRLKMPKVNNQKTETLNTAQLERLTKVLRNDPNRDVANMMSLALFTGMRKGEILGLRWSAVNFNLGFIYLSDPKGGTDQKIPMNGSARTVLQEQRSLHGEDSEYVFPGKGGMRRVAVGKTAVRRIMEAAELTGQLRPFHGLRHAYASLLASSGKVDLYTLQKLLTHQSPQMTQRYAHLHDEALKRGAGVADDVFSGVAK